MKSQGGAGGFTLVELLISMALFAVVTGAIYSSYQMQQKSYQAQEQIARLQQNIRFALHSLSREIRLAGYDPYVSSGTGVALAQATTLTISRVADEDGLDNDADGTVDELAETVSIVISLFDGEGDGDLDLGMQIGAAPMAMVAENIDAVNFVYLDENGTLLNPGMASVTGAALGRIRSVEITLIGRTQRPDVEITDSAIYTNQQGDNILAAAGDHFRRRRLSTRVQCRNLRF